MANKKKRKKKNQRRKILIGVTAGVMVVAAGAVAGSVVPGIGNVAGAVVGFVGGLIGGAIASWGAGKVMDAALNEKDSLNKTEAQLYAEEQNKTQKEQAKQLAEQADKSPEKQEELILAAAQKAKEEGGFDDEETLKAFEELVAQKESNLNESQSTNTPEYENSLAQNSEYEPVINQLEAIANLNYCA